MNNKEWRRTPTRNDGVADRSGATDRSGAIDKLSAISGSDAASRLDTANGSGVESKPSTAYKASSLLQVEVCCSSPESARIADRCSADRIELCKDLLADGRTPDETTIGQVCEEVSLPVHVLIRPRAGSFHYSSKELGVMEEQIRRAMQFPIAGIVIGHVNDQHQPDPLLLKEWREMTRGIDLTFHRAFDRVADPFEVLEMLVEAGFDRVLMSGGMVQGKVVSADQGLDALVALNEKSSGRITIMPGGGITPENVHLFVKHGFDAIHLSAKGTLLPKGPSLTSGISIDPTPRVEPVADERVLTEVLRVVRRMGSRP